MRTAILGLAAALSCSAALAQTAPIATAPATPSTADQIDAFIKTTPVPDVTRDGAAGVTSSAEPERDGKIHGVVEVGVGSNGYRHAYGRATMPVGDNGQVSVAIDQTRFNGRFGHGRFVGDGRPYAADTISLGAEWHAGDGLDPCRRRFATDDPAAAPAPGVPGACRMVERTGP